MRWQLTGPLSREKVLFYTVLFLDSFRRQKIGPMMRTHADALAADDRFRGRKFCSTLFYAVPHCYTNFELHRERVGRIRTPNCLTTTARCLRPRPPLMNHWATLAFLRRPSRRRHGGNAGQKQNRRLHEPTLPVVPRRLVNAISPPRRPAAPSPCGSHVQTVLRRARRW